MGQQIRQKTKLVESTKKADIVFCIDNSGSMSDCIDGVRETVGDFVSTLETGAGGQSPVDWRIGLVNYSDDEFIFLDLLNETSTFKNKLGKSVKGYDEYTPGAIDYAISKTSWREGSQRIIVVFTDETLETGAGGGNRFDDLLAKIVNSHIQIIYYGPDCKYYRKFEQCPKCEVNIVSDFSGVSFDALMNRLAVTVSSGNAFAGKDPVDKKQVYRMTFIKISK